VPEIELARKHNAPIIAENMPIKMNNDE